jgi:hypothetical protein
MKGLTTYYITIHRHNYRQGVAKVEYKVCARSYRKLCETIGATILPFELEPDSCYKITYTINDGDTQLEIDLDDIINQEYK